MKKYEAPDFVKIDFATEEILGDSIVEAGGVKEPIDLGPAVDFGW